MPTVPTDIEASTYFNGPFRFDDKGGAIWMPSKKGGETKVIDIRGWGYLTGGGGGALGLDDDEGARAQDAFGRMVADALNAYAEIKALRQQVVERDAEIVRLRIELESFRSRYPYTIARALKDQSHG